MLQWSLDERPGISCNWLRVTVFLRRKQCTDLLKTIWIHFCIFLSLKEKNKQSRVWHAMYCCCLDRLGNVHVSGDTAPPDCVLIQNLPPPKNQNSHGLPSKRSLQRNTLLLALLIWQSNYLGRHHHCGKAKKQTNLKSIASCFQK